MYLPVSCFPSLQLISRTHTQTFSALYKNIPSNHFLLPSSSVFEAIACPNLLSCELTSLLCCTSASSLQHLLTVLNYIWWLENVCFFWVFLSCVIIWDRVPVTLVLGNSETCWQQNRIFNWREKDKITGNHQSPFLLWLIETSFLGPWAIFPVFLVLNPNRTVFGELKGTAHVLQVQTTVLYFFFGQVKPLDEKGIRVMKGHLLKILIVTYALNSTLIWGITLVSGVKARAVVACCCIARYPLNIYGNLA